MSNSLPTSLLPEKANPAGDGGESKTTYKHSIAASPRNFKPETAKNCASREPVFQVLNVHDCAVEYGISATLARIEAAEALRLIGGAI